MSPMKSSRSPNFPALSALVQDRSIALSGVASNTEIVSTTLSSASTMSYLVGRHVLCPHAFPATLVADSLKMKRRQFLTY